MSETFKIENKEILNNTNNIRKILMILRNLNETFEWNEELPVFKIKNSDYVIIQSKYGSYLLDLDNLKENREISEYEYKVINDSIQNLKNINDYYKLNSKILDNFFYNKIFNFYKNFW